MSEDTEAQDNIPDFTDMNIYANKGDKVIFTGKNGTDHDKEYATKKGLKVGATYTIESTDVGGWHTTVYLQEVPNASFNSVMFMDHPTAPKAPPPPSTAEYRITRVGNLMTRSGSKTLDGQPQEVAHPNIALDTVFEGYFPLGLPVIGKGIIFVAETENGRRLSYNESGFFSSPVTKIENHFYYTKNSVYKIEKLPTE